MFGFFIIRKLFDIECISDHVQPISKPHSVVLAGVVILWSPGLWRNIHVVTWSVQEYACRARTLWSMCMVMHELTGWVFKAWFRVRIFQWVSERVSYGIFRTQYFKVTRRRSSDMDSDSVNEVSQIDIDSQISTSIRSSKSEKKGIMWLT